ncbi:MAG: hypothetical protein JXR88_16275 [Clostridia bacterium]|nr:hypothetical protein [Clostridia bacterium]
MRITQQQIQTQLLNVKNQSKGMPQMKTGAILNGKILEIQGNALLIALAEGGTLRAEANDVERFFVNQNINFEVVNDQAEVVQVALLSEKTVEEIKVQLQSIDLEHNEENVKAYEVLKALDLPVTKDHIIQLTQNLKQLNVLFSTLKEFVQTEKSESEIITNLAKELGYESEKALMNTDLKSVVIQLLKSYDLKEGEVRTSNIDIKETPTQSLNQEETPVKPQALKPLEMVVKNIFGLKTTEALKPELNDTLDKLGQLLKLEKPVTLNNLQILDRLFDTEKIDQQIKTLLPMLEKDYPEPKLLALLRGLMPHQFENKNEVTNFFNALINQLSEAEKFVSEHTKDQVVKLQESVKFMEKEQSDFTWIQVPVQMRNETKHLDIMIKNNESSKTKLSKHQAKILISLDTHYLKRVQSLIEVNYKQLNIHFKVENENIQKLIESQLAGLRTYFEDYFEKIHIDVKTTQLENLKSFVDPGYDGYLNLKV